MGKVIEPIHNYAWGPIVFSINFFMHEHMGHNVWHKD